MALSGLNGGADASSCHGWSGMDRGVRGKREMGYVDGSREEKSGG